MRVLLVEDQLHYVSFIAKDLEDTYGHQVTTADSPPRARELLRDGDFEVVVADLFFGNMLAEFNARQQARGRPTLTGGLVQSGLSVIHDAAKLSIPSVMWTSAEPNRGLHIVFAHHELKVRTFCSKSSTQGTFDLNAAIRAADKRQEFVDPMVQPYIPPANAATLAATVLSGSVSQRAMWRALALGACTNEHIADLIGINSSTVKNLIGEMYDKLSVFDARFGRVDGFNPGRTKIAALTRYAEANKEFFLDEAVRVMYP